MASEKELAESQAASWYVSRNIELPVVPDAGRIPKVVEGADGTTLTILDQVFQGDAPWGAATAYRAQLSVPGLIRAKLDVDVEIAPFDDEVVSIGLRPSTRTLRYPISPIRYFDATWSVLDALAAELSSNVPVNQAA